MRCVLGFKWARDPEDARVDASGTVTWRGSKLAVSDEDAAAAVLARGLGAEEIVGLTIGEGDASWAGARGASRTVSIGDATPGPDSSAAATALAAGVRYIGGADVVVLGDCPWDRMVAVLVGAYLGWPVLAGVLEAGAEDGVVRVARRTRSGEETVLARTPVVLAVTARHAELRPPGMQEVLAARKLPVERLTLADLGVDAPNRVTLRGSALPPARQAQVLTGEGAAGELVAALRSEGVL